MNKNYIFIALALIVVVSVGIFIANNIITNAKPETNNSPAGNFDNNSENNSNSQAQGEVKEFTMTAFYDDTGIWFSLKEISVNKGDIVRIKITNIKGNHDFTLDEYGIKETTPLNQEVVIEFVADKAGEFIYYCSVPGHRQKGQWGVLRVTE